MFFLSDEVISILYIILSSFYSVLAFLVYRKYKGTVQARAYLLITIAFFLDFLANLLWVFSINYYGSVDSVPYPYFTDVLWLTYYVLLTAGIVYYWFNIWKGFNKGYPSEWFVCLSIILLVSSVLITPLLQAYDALYDFIIDPLYFALPLTAGIACIPLIKLFKGGKLSKPWLYLCIGVLFFAVAEPTWVYELTIESSHDISDLFYVTGYFFVIGSFIKILTSFKMLDIKKTK